ncbi:MAG: alpha/beta fold hydrolase [Pseudomonadota bacterium]|nr:alpha/beta fold hydrolase [Pseudomonadota bacterium]
MERMKGQYSVRTIDLPGHGASPWPPRFCDLASLASLVGEALPPRTMLLGWSLGAMVALELARTQAGRVSALVLVGATPRFVAAAHWPYGVAPAVLETFARQSRENPGQMLEDFLELQVRGAAHADLTLAALKRSVLACAAPHPEALEAGLGVLRSTDLTATLGHIRQPVLVVSGQYDRVTSPQAARALASALPSAHAVVIRRAAHAPFLSHPDEFLAQVLPFMETLAAA